MDIPETGSTAAVVAQRIREVLQGDAQPQRNLASFVTTWMEEEAEQLACESLNKNLINTAEYPETEAMQQRVINMIAKLFHADTSADADNEGFLGTTTVGSSEAIMLALLAHKGNWKNRQRRNPARSGKDRPYLLIGTHTHACFAKFARYFDVGVKWICLEPGQYAVTAAQVQAVLEQKIVDDIQVMEDCAYTPEEAGERRVGELVMAVACVVCTTFTANMDDVAGIDRALAMGGWDIPIHVDAAAGGFILPFTRPSTHAEELQWDFRLPHVQSINVSNHKYGLVYAGLGTVVFRDKTIVPQELLVNIDYLSGDMRNYSLNFSRPSNGVVLQYYNFLRLGKAGYRRLIQDCLSQAQEIAHAFRTSPGLADHFEVISKTEYFPVVVVRFKEGRRPHSPFTLTTLAQALKKKGWMVPVYRLPANAEEIEVLRIVVRPDFNDALTGALLSDLEASVREVVRVATRCRKRETAYAMRRSFPRPYTGRTACQVQER
jgi:glutamate decarboxylase